MKVNVFLVSLAAVASVLFAASLASATPAAHLASVIGGRVVDSVDQRPLSGVQVDVFDDSLGSHASTAIATTMTHKDGSFSLLGLRSGNYHLELVKRGYALEIVTGVSVRSDERLLISEPFGMRTAIVTTGIGQAMETRL
jgi:hypothetical protein